MKPKHRGFYDIEAENWTRARCFNVMSDVGPSQHSTFSDKGHSVSPERVLEMGILEMFSLAERWNFCEFWAHNGGKFDTALLFPIFIDLGATLEAAFSGGRCIALKAKLDGTTITLKDSYALIPASLKKACESFQIGNAKLFREEDYETVHLWADDFLRRGCQIDCELVAALLEKLEDIITDFGGVMKSTAASTALSVLKANSSLIDVSRSNVNNWCREAYYGGRVEVFWHAPTRPVKCYDVCSSYPYSLSQELPGYPTAFQAMPKDTVLNDCDVYHATVEVAPTTFLPVLPVRVNGGLYFPTGRFTGRWLGHELKAAQRIGGAVIQRLHGVQRFTVVKPFEAFVERLYKEKATAKGARREVVKLLLNSAYGKLGERPEKQALLVLSSQEEGIALMAQADANYERIRGGEEFRFWLKDTFRWPKHTHYAQAAMVTARSRVLLADYLAKAGLSIAYADTDCVHSFHSFDTGSELGQLKAEGSGIGRYFAPKLYTIQKQEGTVYHSKGFYLPRAHIVGYGKAAEDTRSAYDAEFFSNVTEGEPVIQPHLPKLKSLARGAKLEMDRAFLKRWNGLSTKRRVTSKSGETVPWGYAELQEGRHLLQRSPLARPLKGGKKVKP